MNRTKTYLLLQALLWTALALWLSLAAVQIYREGALRKAEHPLEPIYTREAIEEKTAPIAPLFWITLGLTAAGLLLGIQDEKEKRPAQDPELTLNFLSAQIQSPSKAMKKARLQQRIFSFLGWAFFALCLLPAALYLIDKSHFPASDPEAMILSLLRVLIPWTLGGLALLFFFDCLRKRSLQKELEAARECYREERKEILEKKELFERKERVEAKDLETKVQTQKKSSATALRVLLLMAALVFLLLGIANGSARDVFTKAANICTECIGLG